MEVVPLVDDVVRRSAVVGVVVLGGGCARLGVAVTLPLHGPTALARRAPLLADGAARPGVAVLGRIVGLACGAGWPGQHHAHEGEGADEGDAARDGPSDDLDQ